MHRMYTLFHEPLKKIKKEIESGHFDKAEEQLALHMKFESQDINDAKKHYLELFRHVKLYNQHLETALGLCVRKENPKVASENIDDAMKHYHQIVDELTKVISVAEVTKKDGK